MVLQYIAPQVPHSCLKGGMGHLHHILRYTVNKAHYNEPLITNDHAPKLMLLHESSIHSGLYFAFKKEHCIPESLFSA